MHNFTSINKTIALCQKAYERFLKIRGKPREIALGMALGLFVGMTPFFGIHMAIAVLIAAIFKWNKISAAMGVWISNPITAPVIYSLTYFLGSKLLGKGASFTPPGELSLSFIIQLFRKSPEILWVLTVGGVLVGLPLAIVGYYLSHSSILKYQTDLRGKLKKTKELKVVVKGRDLLSRTGRSQKRSSGK
jgi:uncharacterized protein (DUF2062 family)